MHIKGPALQEDGAPARRRCVHIMRVALYHAGCIFTIRVASLQCELHLYNAGCGLHVSGGAQEHEAPARRRLRREVAVPAGCAYKHTHTATHTHTHTHTHTFTHTHSHTHAPSHLEAPERVVTLGASDFGISGFQDFRISGFRDAGISGFGITVKGFGLGDSELGLRVSELGLRVSESAHPTVVIVTRTNHQPVVTFGISPDADVLSGSYLRGSTQ
jgi:hypothetical protein